jgi:hypothetical protein
LDFGRRFLVLVKEENLNHPDARCLGLWVCTAAVPSGTGKPASAASLPQRFLSANSRLQLDLQIAQSDVSAKLRLGGWFRRAGDALKLRVMQSPA